MSIIGNQVRELTQAQKLARLEQTVQGLVNAFMVLFDATSETHAGCEACKAVNESCSATLAHFGIQARRSGQIETLNG